VRAGDTFLFVREEPRHLWTIISDPELDPERVLIVNFTSWQAYHDQSCVLEGGVHPFVHHRTCVNYRQARVTTVSALEALQQDGLLEPHEHLSPELLRRIRNCAGDSRVMPLECFSILDDQDLLDPDE
jgi:hypothetical protein